VVDGLMAMCGVRRRDMGRNGWAEIARSLNGIGTCLVVASLGLSVLWGFTSWSRLGIYVGAAFLVVGLTIVADEHFRKDQDTPGFREDQDPPG